ncbi:hypothetical protein D3C84_788000 [compost metagenome]
MSDFERDRLGGLSRHRARYTQAQGSNCDCFHGVSSVLLLWPRWRDSCEEAQYVNKLIFSLRLSTTKRADSGVRDSFQRAEKSVFTV